ncbi:hypothetical protein EVJ58_g6267 [Rhodofomes roseus]|uniref:Major facilitator superfamily (MFS) profile domain-containing protein n=1 Tax=Rhodofomes roseus TaxID=34475 RepID=A0A4Y9Y927_9APHY|nr:hypothetical protein EVJ58_g6267 [Rhodofomes roseus]
MLGCIVAATSKTISVLIGMRCVQAAGSSAVLSIGAATLADIFEPAERGTMMGIYYSAPSLGPSLGPILGGLLTQGFNWRATFWFLTIFSGLCLVSFVFFRDTFRRERSLAYQTALKRVLEREAKKAAAGAARSSVPEKTADSANVQTTVVPASDRDSEGTDAAQHSEESDVTDRDVEAQATLPATAISEAVKEARLSLRDVSPVGPMIRVFHRPNNIVIFCSSAILFASNFSLTYTAARTLANEYHYDALDTGLVLLAYGIGCVLGSVLGGRYSDHIFTKMRLQSTFLFMPLLPASMIAYGWVCEEHVHVASICVMLFLVGFSQISIYSSTLAYIVDSNVGRSSSAIATNSFVRGLTAFVATEVAVPLQNAMGDGGLYSLWGGLTLVCDLLIILVWWKGGRWREKAIANEARKSGMTEHA